MDLGDDERAQTVQVGAILLLGTLVIALSVYQVTSVPGQNGATEFTHNQRVHEQLQEVRTAILDTAAEDTGRSATVALGTRYRDRIVAVNPGPPSGTLRTTDLGAVAIGNAVAARSPETRDLWNGSQKRYSSTALAYEPNYNEYSNAPTTVYEHSVLANQFESGDRATLLLSNETMIDGREITLVTLDGSLSETGSGTASVDTRPVSVSETIVPIRNSAGKAVTLTLPTTLPESRWKALLGDATFVEGISYVEGAPRNRVTIRLKPGETYRLRMAKIAVGSGATTEPATYLTDLPGDGQAVAENDSRRVRVEVRDRYNNPVSNESVNLTVMTTADGAQPGELWTGDERGDVVRVTTDERGRASATYRAPTTIDGDPVRVTIGASRTGEIDPAGSFDPRSPNTVRFAFTVTNTDESPRPYDIEWNRTALANQPGIECGPAGCTYNRSAGSLTVPLRTTPVTPDAAVAVESTDRRVATVTAGTDRTGSDGTATARIDVSGPGTVVLSVSSGKSSDTLSLTTENQAPNASIVFSPGTPRTGDLVSFSANAADPDGRDADLEYTWDFGDGSRGYGPSPQHAYDDPGIYDVSLTVIDEYGANRTTNRTITVSNRAPNAVIDYYPLAPHAGETVTFSGARSSDPDSEISRYEWEVTGPGGETDSTSTIDTQVRGTLRQAGTYVVSLTVTDDDGATSETSATVVVEEANDDGDGGSGSGAAIENIGVTDRSNPGQDRYDVTAELSNPTGEIDRVEYRLVDADTGEVLDTDEDREISGGRDTSTASLKSRGGTNRRDRYRIVVIAYDGTTELDRDERTVSGIGRR